MKFKLSYIQHHLNKECSHHEVSLPYEVDDGTRLCTFQLTKESLDDLVQLLNANDVRACLQP